jgi:hypothetical protein
VANFVEAAAAALAALPPPRPPRTMDAFMAHADNDNDDDDDNDGGSAVTVSQLRGIVVERLPNVAKRGELVGKDLQGLHTPACLRRLLLRSRRPDQTLRREPACACGRMLVCWVRRP